MSNMAKFPYLTPRKGSRNLYYKRDVDPALAAGGRPKQIWRSLKTADRKKAEKAYAAQHAEIELLLEQWRTEDQQSAVSADNTIAAPSALELPITPLTPSLLKRLTDAYYQQVFEVDFKMRGELWTAAEKDEEAFWQGDIIEHPKDDTQELRGQEFSYYAHLMGEPELEPVFLYCLHWRRKKRLQDLRRQHALGITGDQEAAVQLLLNAQGVRLSQDDCTKLVRKLLQIELKAVQDIIARDETTFDAIVAAQSIAPQTILPAPAKPPGELMSVLVDRYIPEASRERSWPKKTIDRKKSELNEFIEICGDKPANQYGQPDGVAFKDAQTTLPANRQKPPFKGLPLNQIVAMAKDLQARGSKFTLLSPTTIKDKINTVAGFFAWVMARDATALNPVATLKFKSSKKNRGGDREPFTVDELSKLFRAPIYTGCLSRKRWSEPGDQVLDDSSIYWVPLIALFSGLRLGEIIQLETNDIKTQANILHFDITVASSISATDGRGSDKSLKTRSSRRKVPIHRTLLTLGFDKYVEERRASGDERLFAEFNQLAQSPQISANVSP
jgi:integrase